MKISTRFLQRDYSKSERIVKEIVKGIVDNQIDIDPREITLDLSSSGLTGAGIVVNNSCNYSCSYCYLEEGSWLQQGDKTAFDLDVLEFTAKAASRAVDYMIVPAMEPFKDSKTASKTLRICEVAKEEGIITSVITNASGLSNLQCGELSEKIDDIGISLDSADKKINDSLRGKRSYERTVRGLESLLEAGYPSEQISLLSTFTQTPNVTLLEFAKKYGIGRIPIGACVLSQTPTAKEYSELWSQVINEFLSKMDADSPKVVFYGIFENPSSVIGLIKAAEKQIDMETAQYNPVEHALMIPLSQDVPLYVQITPAPFELIGFPRIIGKKIGRCFDSKPPTIEVTDEEYFLRIDQKLRECVIDNETRPLIEQETNLCNETLLKYKLLLEAELSTGL